MVDMLGGGALETDFILGRRTRVSREYQGRCVADGDVGADCNSSRSSCPCPCCVCCRSISLWSSSSPLLSGPWVLEGDASPVSSVNSCSFEQGDLGSCVSRSSSLKTDFRPLLILVDMEKDGGLPEPSRIRSSVHLWWNRGLAERAEGISGADDDFFGSWLQDMTTTAS